MNPDPTLTAASPAFAVFLQGLALSFGLIVAIGAQNAFVLRQGLRREHVASVVLFCAVADAVLIAAGVLGMAQALGQSPMLARALAWAGALFLLLYGWRALRRALGLYNGTDAAAALLKTPAGAPLRGKLTEATLRRLSKLEDSDDEAADY